MFYRNLKSEGKTKKMEATFLKVMYNHNHELEQNLLFSVHYSFVN